MRATRIEPFPKLKVRADRRLYSPGVQLYEQFNVFAPVRSKGPPSWLSIPPVVVELGQLVGLIYRSDKGKPGYPSMYIHFLENPPRLVSNVAGTQLYLVGGSYQVTSRGIEG